MKNCRLAIFPVRLSGETRARNISVYTEWILGPSSWTMNRSRVDQSSIITPDVRRVHLYSGAVDLIHSLPPWKPIGMHWILRILREIARRFRLRRRGGRIEMASWIRLLRAEIRKILTANNIRQSEERDRKKLACFALGSTGAKKRG